MIATDSSGPSPRTAATLVTGGSASSPCLILFGGMYVYPNHSVITAFNDVWVFHVDSSRWRKVIFPPEHQVPVPRFHHTSTMVSDSRMVVFGGAAGDTSTLNDTWVFDFNEETWTQIGATTTCPPSRSGHVAVHFMQTVLVFGGCVGDSANEYPFCAGYTNATSAQYDVWTLVLNTTNITLSWWQQAHFGNQAPSSWYAASTHIMDENSSCIFVQGGLADGYVPQDKAFFLCDDDPTWSPVQTTLISNIPSARYGHAIAYLPVPLSPHFSLSVCLFSY
jgi:hypothetical protein